MRLLVGTRAPGFKVEDIFGQPIELQQYVGKPVLLSFLRNGACALCNLHVHKLIQKYDEFHRQGLEILTVFESPRESVLQYVSKQDAPFSIIADPQAHLYTLYSVESSEEKVSHTPTPKQMQLVAEAQQIGYSLTQEPGSNFFRLPADFLIGADQIIQKVYYSEAVGDHMAFEEIEQILLQQSSQTAR